MIPHDAFINIIKAHGYQFKEQSRRVVLYRKKGHTKVITIRKCDFHDEQWVRNELRSIGLESEEIQKFIGGTSVEGAKAKKY